MGAMRNLWRLAAGAALAFGLASMAAAAPPKVTAVPGDPVLALASYDLKAMGFVVEEYFLAGDAASYKLVGEAKADGVWAAEAAGTAPYVTRIVVVRPADPKKFNGTAAVEWLNVTSGQDIGPDWSFTHRELMRSGYVWVGVSAQKVGVEGGASMGGASGGLKKLKPDRYGGLSHPGDAYAFDIYSQAGRVVRDGHVLGPLKAKRVLSIGESQSAIFLTTYVNAIDPLAKVYDGFLIHSRFGGAPAPDAASIQNRQGAPSGVKYRPDLRVPVMTLIAETDLIGSGLSGYWGARRPDDAHLRVWEMPGTAHADTYMLMAAATDSGSVPIDKFAALLKPSATTIVGRLAKPINSAPQHHYVAQSALAHLDAWVRIGRAPPSAPPMETTTDAAGAPKLVLDANGNTKGGVRTPWVDTPTAKLSGLGNSGGAFGFLFGVTEVYDAATLNRLYPGGKADYLKAFDASLAKAVKAGFLLPADQAEIRALAAASYPAEGS